MSKIYTHDEINKMFGDGRYTIVSNEYYYNAFTPVTFMNVDGYLFETEARNIIRYKDKNMVSKNNKYSINNINRYLEINSLPFKCISKEYRDALSELEFVCKRCNEHIMRSWNHINRNGENRSHIQCPNCDGRTESIHVLVLKQMFKYHYPDTVEEDKTCRNPKTGKILPTDIVNHRLKIAVEVQSQWHDFPDHKYIDEYKKKFWTENGYKFYDPDIRDYTVLEMCRLFFDIEELPDYINYEYSNKINIKKIQEMLNSGMQVLDIAKQLGIKEYRIYDALHFGKLSYPNDYRNACYTPIVQLDMNGNYVNEFKTISDAEALYGFKHGGISRSLALGRHYSNGSYWYYKDEYDPDKVKLKSRFSKFMIPVNKYDLQGNLLCSYDSILDASKDCNMTNTQIYRVVIGERNNTGGFIFKEAA